MCIHGGEVLCTLQVRWYRKLKKRLRFGGEGGLKPYILQQYRICLKEIQDIFGGGISLSIRIYLYRY